MNDVYTYYPDNFKDQFYFLSDEAVKIREYLSSLKEPDINNNNNINVQLNNSIYNYPELAQKVAVLTGKSQHYKNICVMLQTDEALKVILALLYKGFGWRNEIYETFNISSNLYVQNTLHTLHSLDLLTKSGGTELNDIFYDALLKIKNFNIGGGMQKAEIYYINEQFLKFCSLLKDLFEHKAKTSYSFINSLDKIIRDARWFNRELNKILDIELSLNRRGRVSNGVYYETETIKRKKFNLEIQKASSKSTDLVTIQSKEIQLFNKNNVSRKPIISHNGRLITEEDLKRKIHEYEEFERAPTIIGNQELPHEESIFDSGVYLSRTGRAEYVSISKQSPEKAIDMFFDQLGRYPSN